MDDKFLNIALAPALRNAADILTELSDTPRLDAELLAAFALKMSRGDMLMQVRDLTAPPSFTALLKRRIAHEPVAYITGTQAFWDLELRVTPDVLIPRADSETLIEAAQRAFIEAEGPMRVLDLGTGSGALLLAALSIFPKAQGVGIDASINALAVAQNNSVRLGFAERADMRHISWLDKGWQAKLDGAFDLILCNPPYVETEAKLDKQVAEYEPHSALFAGQTGLDDYLILVPALHNLLSPSGVAVVEIGYQQAKSVSDLANMSGLSSLMTHDLSGNPRCLTMRIN
jgi:release factor glutamine methyltransferase